MRGKEIVFCELWANLRITPACAGKSGSAICAPSQNLDHPRVCGEKAVRTVLVLDRMGSPPRVRGKESESEDKDANARITPACAGKRDRHGSRTSKYRDHPRVCGEK